MRAIIVAILFPTTLFLPAGRIDWLWGWIYIGTVIVGTIVTRLWVGRRHPGLIAERARSLDAQDAKRPNFLFIIVDDQSPYDLKIYDAASPLETPVIDSRYSFFSVTQRWIVQFNTWASISKMP